MDETKIQRLTQVSQAVKALNKAVDQAIRLNNVQGVGSLSARSYQNLQAQARDLLPNDFYVGTTLVLEDPADDEALLLGQWATFIVLALLFRIPAITTRLIPRPVRHWRASNLARRQFIEQNLHHTAGETGLLIFVSEAEHYVEILADRGISSRIDNAVWESIVARFTSAVREGKVLQGFLQCIEACGEHLHREIPATHERNELPNRLVVLD